MKIASLAAYPVKIADRNQLIIRVETTCGVVGWGESGLTTRETAVAHAVEDLGDWLEGQDPLAPGRVWDAFFRRPGTARDRVGMALLSAIDIALHDIAGKALDLPVHKLLGGALRHRVATFGCVRADDIERLLDLARGALHEGWTCLRLGWRTDDPQVFDPADAIGRWPGIFAEARRALGQSVVLGSDLHHRFSVAEAAAFMARCPEGTLDFVEEPIRDESPTAYAALRRLSRTPLAIGEEFTSRWQFQPYVEGGLLDFARIDVCNVGGLTEAMRIGGWCATHGVDVMPHNPLGPICTAASVHMAAALPNHSYLECWETPGDDNAHRQISPVFPTRLRLDDAAFPVPDTPGLGIEVDEAALAVAPPFDYTEAPHLRRSDGAFTNW